MVLRGIVLDLLKSGDRLFALCVDCYERGISRERNGRRRERAADRESCRRLTTDNATIAALRHKAKTPIGRFT